MDADLTSQPEWSLSGQFATARIAAKTGSDRATPIVAEVLPPSGSVPGGVRNFAPEAGNQNLKF
jgi:hypothetical protein